jgi:hypothetical protein
MELKKGNLISQILNLKISKLIDILILGSKHSQPNRISMLV